MQTQEKYLDVFLLFQLIVYQPLLGAVFLHALPCNMHTSTRLDWTPRNDTRNKNLGRIVVSAIIPVNTKQKLPKSLPVRVGTLQDDFTTLLLFGDRSFSYVTPLHQDIFCFLVVLT